MWNGNTSLLNLDECVFNAELSYLLQVNVSVYSDKASFIFLKTELCYWHFNGMKS